MKKLNVLASLLITVLVLSCSEDESTPLEATLATTGAISGGPFTFCVDGTPDMVTGIEVTTESNVGSMSTWVVTDAEGKILGLPPTVEALEGVDFDEAGAGVCLVWYLRYDEGLEGLEPGENANDLNGTFDLSNSVEVTRNKTEAGELIGGPFEFTVDGMPDMVSGISLNNPDSSGTNSTYVITDSEGKILGLPPTLTAVKGVDFDGAGVGTCLIWYLRFEDGLKGAEVGLNANDLDGCFELSNPLTVIRNQGETMASAGTLMGDDFFFCVDGTPDYASGITLDDSMASGSSSGYIITEVNGNILGLPPTLAAVEGVDFDAAGPDICRLYHITYNGNVDGREVGGNIDGISGDFALSNPIVVTRALTQAGEISAATEFNFTVDGTPDYVTGIMRDDTATGSLNTWVITDDQGNILGLPPTINALEGVNFDAASPGICLIWYLRYEEGIKGLEAGANANDLEGCFDLSNSLSVTRN